MSIADALGQNEPILTASRQGHGGKTYILTPPSPARRANQQTRAIFSHQMFRLPPVQLALRATRVVLRATRAALRAVTWRPRRHQPLHEQRLALDLGPQDVVLMTVHSLDQFDALFACVPFFALEAPAPAKLILYIEPTLAELPQEQLRLLGLQLRSGAPFAKTWLCTNDAGVAQRLREELDLHVHVCPHDKNWPEPASLTFLEAPPSLEISEFGPVALLISALWGRVGSTTVFDNQARFLLENGALLVRIFIDHYPGATNDAPEDLLAENFSAVRPHIHLVAERDTEHQSSTRLRASSVYASGSGVRRFELELAGAKCSVPGLLAWAGEAADLAIVNHAAHMAFAERITRAPIVLETHDVLTEQLALHGWPDFVSLRGEPTESRHAEEQSIWRRAAVCATISPEDHAKIAPHARLAILVKPAATEATPSLRPWSEVVRANHLDSAFAASEDIDVLLWGDWHAGNVRAVEWVLGQVRHAGGDALAEARFAVIGRVSRLVGPPLLHQRNTVSCDFVDRLEDFFGRSKVLALADHQGSGISIKAIDTIRYGRAFTTTSAGMRGLSFDALEHRPSDTASAFAADLIALLQSAEARTRRANLAREIYARNISLAGYNKNWRAIVEHATPTFFSREVVESERRRQRLARAGAPMPAALAPVLARYNASHSDSSKHPEEGAPSS